MTLTSEPTSVRALAARLWDAALAEPLPAGWASGLGVTAPSAPASGNDGEPAVTADFPVTVCTIADAAGQPHGQRLCALTADLSRAGMFWLVDALPCSEPAGIEALARRIPELFVTINSDPAAADLVAAVVAMFPELARGAARGTPRPAGSQNVISARARVALAEGGTAIIHRWDNIDERVRLRVRAEVPLLTSTASPGNLEPAQAGAIVIAALERALAARLAAYPGFCTVRLPEYAVGRCALVSVQRLFPGQAQQIMHRIWGDLRFSLIRKVVVVDDSIDVFDDYDVEWAVATRAQPDRDSLIVQGYPPMTSVPASGVECGGQLSARWGVDAMQPDYDYAIDGHKHPDLCSDDDIVLRVEEKWDSYRIPGRADRKSERSA